MYKSMWRRGPRNTQIFSVKILGITLFLCILIASAQDDVIAVSGKITQTQFPFLSISTIKPINQTYEQPAVQPTVVAITETSQAEYIENRFTGLLSHVRWLLANQSNTTSLPDAELIRINKQFESLSDDIGDAARSSGVDSLSELTIDENLAIGAYYLSGDGDDEGIRITASGAVQLTAAFLDAAGNAGVAGYILQSTGTSTNWVATSSLGINTLSNDSVIPDYVLSSGKNDEYCLTYEATGDTWEWQSCASGSITTADIDTSAELAGILTDETGTAGSVVFSESPTFTGTTQSNNANFSGNVGIGTTTPTADLEIYDATNPELAITSGAAGTADIRLSGNRLNDNNAVARLVAYNASDDVAQIAFYRDGNDDAGAMRFYTQQNGSSLQEKMRLDSLGRLSIGTTSAAALLTVGGTPGSQFLVSSGGVITGGTWNGAVIGDAYLTKTGNWTGTFDGQEGIYYLSRANHTGTQTLATISDAGALAALDDLATFDTDDLSEGTTNLYFTNARARSALSETITGIDYAAGTGIFSLTSGYVIPLSASTTQWAAAYSWGDHTVQNYFDLDTDNTDDLTEGATNLFSQWSSTSTGISYETGNVIIGGNTPYEFYPLAVENFQSGATGYGISAYVEGNPSVNNARYGAADFLAYSASGNATDMRYLYGVYGNAGYDGVGTIDYISGVTGSVDNYSSGVVDLAKGVEVYLGNYGSGLITDARGLMINDLANTGTITDTFGLYIGDLSVGTQTNSPYSIYSSDANTLNYFAGNVGIGTTTPDSRLTVVGTDFPVLNVIRDTAVTDEARGVGSLVHRTSSDMVDGFGADLSFRIADSAGVINTIANLGAVRDGADTEGAFTFRAGTNGLEEFMRITSAGNVGIGDTSPAYKLTVGNGDLFGVTSGGAARATAGSAAAPGYGFTTDGTTGLYLAGTDQFGLSGGGRSLIEGSTTTISLNPMNGFQSEGTLQIGRNDGVARYHTITSYNDSVAANNYLRFNVHNGTPDATTLALALTGAGRVGIGTTSPYNRLQVVPENYGDQSAFGIGYDLISGGYTGLAMGLSSLSGGYATMQAVEFSGSTFGNLILNPSGGNIGVGTTTPGSRLEVNGTARISGFANPTSGSGMELGFNGTSFIQSYNRTGSSYLDLNLIGANILFSANGTEDMRIASNGNIGIGTTTPNRSLVVSSVGQGALQVDSTSGASSVALFSTADVARGYVGYINQGSTGMGFLNSGGSIANLLVTDSGNVGIGTINPQTTFQVGTGASLVIPDGAGSIFTPQATIQATSGVAGLTVGVSDGTNNRRSGLFVDDTNSLWGLSMTYSSNEPEFVIRSAGDEILRINDQGYLGIGTTSPSGKLHLDSGALNNAMYVTNTAGDAKILFGDTAATDFASIGVVNGGLGLSGTFSHNTGQLFLDNTGNVGIGTTTPLRKLSVAATASVGAEFATNLSSSSYVDIRDANLNYIRLGSFNGIAGIAGSPTTVPDIAIVSNQVGIGTTSPAAKLHVDGDIALGTPGGPARSLLGYDTSAAAYTQLIYWTGDSAILGRNFLGGSVDNWYVRTAGVDRLTVNSIGNVGIGTTTPNQKLTVSGGGIQIDNNQYLRSRLASGASVQIIGYDAGNNTIVGANGEIRLAGSINLVPDTNGDTNVTADADSDFAVGTNMLFVQGSTGDVGLGIAAPNAELQVIGDIRVGTSGSNGCLEDFGGGLIAGTCSSDAELKTDITPVATGESFMERFMELNVVTYKWNQTANSIYSKNTSIDNLGLIAQNVESVFPELISYDNEGYRQVDFRAFPFYIIEALKEIWNELSGQNERIEELEERIRQLERKQGTSSPTPAPTPTTPTPDPVEEPTPDTPTEPPVTEPSTPEPEPNPAPEPEPAPESTPTPEPTSTPEPEPTSTPELEPTPEPSQTEPPTDPAPTTS